MNYYDAFISYGRADSKAFATKLNEELNTQGFNVWFDQEDIPLAVDFQEQINDGIEKAHNFLFIIAPHSVNSPYCLKEIELAVKLNKRIIPLLHIEQISYEIWQQRNPQKTAKDWQEYQRLGLHSSFVNIHPEISRINWVYFREEIDNFNDGFTGLISAINQHQDYVQQHTHILSQALDWCKNQKQTNYLLVGQEREQAETWLKQKFINEQPPCIPTDLHCEFICESTKNSQNLLSHVFISASEQDALIRDKIRNTLMRESFTVWANKTDIKTGTEFQEAINQGIEGADNIVYLISKDSLQSKYCQQELIKAIADNKRIIPLLIAEIDLEIIPDGLKKLQFIDFTEYNHENKYQNSADRLLGEIKKAASYYENHKILLVKARKWQRQNRNYCLLLRGYNLQYFEAWLKLAQTHEEHPALPLQTEFIHASQNKLEEYSLEVFISYSRTDSDLARKLNDSLQELGKTTWFDQESIATGTDFKREIYHGIESSDNFVFIISPNSVNSPYCADEVEYAQKLNKRIVTILHRPLSVDDKQKLPPALAVVQWLDFNKHGGEFYANFNELIRTLDTDREHIKNHTKWSQRALEWQEKNHNADLLLRGSEFTVAQEWLKTAAAESKNPPPTDLHRELINQSWQAIAAQKQKEQRQILVLRTLLISASMALIAAVIGGIFAWQQWRNSEQNQAESLGRYSLILFHDQGKDIEAIVTAIKAGKILQNQHFKNPEIWNALLTILFEFREFNRLEGHNSWVNNLSLSSDGNTLASASSDKTVKVWDAKTGREIYNLTGHKESVYGVSISPDGNRLASASEDKTIKIWDIKTGQEIKTLKGHNSWVYGVAFSPDGKTLVSCSADSTIKLWDVDTGTEIHTLTGHKYSVKTVNFSPDGKFLASGSFDKTIKIWDVKTGQEISTLTGHQYSVYSVNFSPDSKKLASASYDTTIKIWNLETGKEIHTLNGHKYSVQTVSFSPDGQKLASGSVDNTVKIWDTATGKLVTTFTGHSNSVKSLIFTPDSHTLISGSDDHSIKFWHLAIGKKVTVINGHNQPIRKIVFSPNGKLLASASEDKTIKIWDAETQKELYTLIGHNDWVRGLSFSPNGKILASSSADKNVKMWNIETGKEIITLKGHQDSVRSVSFSPDGKILASGSSDKTIKLWDVATGKEISTFKGHQGFINSVSFSPNGKILASGSLDDTINFWGTLDNTIKLWDVRTGKEIRTLKGHNSWVMSASFSPDSKTLVSSSNDNTIKLWDVKTGTEIRTFRGHKALVNNVIFSLDGRTLISSSFDNSIKIWNIETGKELRTLTGHTDYVWSVSFSPDGRTLASSSSDQTIRLWTFPNLDSLLTINCHFVRGYLMNNPLHENADVTNDDRNLCDGIGE